MKLRHIFFVSLFFAAAPAIARTPGDAAYRSGHPEQAAELYRKGAEQGDVSAAFKLGLLINRGEVSSEKYGASGKWFVKACDLGDTVACHNAGNGYEYGPEGKDGLDKDYSKAREYYLRAASRGYMPSQYNLGSLYSNKYFDDDVEGLTWLLISQRTARGCPGSQLCAWVLEDPPGHIKKLRERMTPEQEALAEKRASEWTPEKK